VSTVTLVQPARELRVANKIERRLGRSSAQLGC